MTQVRHKNCLREGVKENKRFIVQQRICQRYKQNWKGTPGTCIFIRHNPPCIRYKSFDPLRHYTLHPFHSMLEDVIDKEGNSQI